MRIIEALGALQFLKKKLINFADLGEALGVSRAAISNRHQNSIKGYDDLKKDEIEKLENYFDVSLDDFKEKETNKEEEMKKWFNDMIREEFKKRGL